MKKKAEKPKAEAIPETPFRALRIPKLVHFQLLDGDGILLDLRNQLYFGLDDVGCRIWELVRETGSEEGIYAALCREYEVPAAEVRRDLAEWLDDLVERRLLEVIPPGEIETESGD